MTPSCQRAGTLRRVAVAAGLAALTFSPATAAAHTGQPPEPHDLWSAWSAEPVVLLGLAIAMAVYAAGVRRLWARAGHFHGIGLWQVIAFSAGLAAITFALVSPLDALGSALFSAHMVQHLVLMQIAAPLLVLGRPWVAFVWSFPFDWRRRLGRALRRAPSAVTRGWRVATRPVGATVIYGVAIWLWHVPALYEAALRSEAIHALEHACFLVPALAFWWAMTNGGQPGRRATGLPIICLFVTMFHTGILGALMTFSGRPWYPIYAPYTAAWGLSPVEDQQLAGLIMWVPSGLLYLVALGGLFLAWLGRLERHEPEAAFQTRRAA